MEIKIKRISFDYPFCCKFHRSHNVYHQRDSFDKFCRNVTRFLPFFFGDFMHCSIFRNFSNTSATHGCFCLTNGGLSRANGALPHNLLQITLEHICEKRENRTAKHRCAKHRNDLLSYVLLCRVENTFNS